MPELFAQSYELQPTSPYSPMDSVSAALEEWTAPRWPKGTPWFVLDEPKALRAPDGSVFRWEPFVDGTRRFVEFTWRHPHAGNPAISWSTRVCFAALPDRTYLSIRVANTGPALGRPGSLLTTRPRLLVSLANHFVLRSGGIPITPSPTVLRESEFPSFVRYELFDPERKHPIAFLSPDQADSFVLAPDAFGREFMGLAKTYCAASAASTYALTSEVGRKDLSCFHGAMRIYMPGLDRTSDSRMHPLLVTSRLSRREERMRLAQVLTLMTVRRFEEPGFVSQLRDERALAGDERRASLVSAFTAAQKAASDVHDFQQLAETYAASNSGLQSEIERLQEELEEANHKIAALQYSLAHRDSSAVADAESALTFTPTDVTDAVEQAKELFEDELLILDDAVASAEDSPYLSPEDAARGLAAIAEVSRRMQSGRLGRPIQEVFAQLGMDYAGGLSATTAKKVRQQYTYSHEGVDYACEEHLCFGTSYDPAHCLRIYFSTKQRPNGRVVVAHVGRHKDVMSTT